MRYMLDTNICIYLMRNIDKMLEKRFVALYIGDAGVSSITLGELRVGIEKSGNRAGDEKTLQRLLRDLVVIPFDSQAATAYGILRAAVPSRQRNALDRLIAAHSISRNATLVTNNIADFEDYPGIKLENWTSAV